MERKIKGGVIIGFTEEDIKTDEPVAIEAPATEEKPVVKKTARKVAK